jgi:hypothetical protein
VCARKQQAPQTRAFFDARRFDALHLRLARLRGAARLVRGARDDAYLLLNSRLLRGRGRRSSCGDGGVARRRSLTRLRLARVRGLRLRRGALRALLLRRRRRAPPRLLLRCAARRRRDSCHTPRLRRRRRSSSSSSGGGAAAERIENAPAGAWRRHRGRGGPSRHRVRQIRRLFCVHQRRAARRELHLRRHEGALARARRLQAHLRSKKRGACEARE